jgi:TolB protein
MLVAANQLRRRPAALAVVWLLTAFVVGPASPAGGAPAAGPQGTLVFASDRSGTFQIYSIRADGSQLGQLTRGRAANTGPLFSPDGRRIAFIRTGSQLWVMNADGSGQRKLASSGYQAAWSPDSRRIAYQGDSYAGPLVIMGVNGGGRIVVPGRNSGPSWSPDGRLIAFSRGIGDRTDLMVVGSDGRGPRTVRRKASARGWSPRGEIVFTGQYRSGAGLVGADGRGARRLLRGVITGLAWSPDGRRLAFVEHVRGAELLRLRVASADGRGVRDITPKGAGSIDSPAWSPDSRWIEVRRSPADASHDLSDLVLVAVDGSSSRPLTAPLARPWGSDYRQPSWRPRGATPARLGGPPEMPLPSETV